MDRDARRADPPPSRPDSPGRRDRPVPGHRPGADGARPPQARALAAPARGVRSRQLARPEVEPPPGVPRPRRPLARRARAVPRPRPDRRAKRRAARPVRGIVGGRRVVQPDPVARATLSRPLTPASTRNPSPRPMHGDDVTQSEHAPSPVDRLADQFWDDILELNPTTATVYGDERFNDRLEDPSPAGRAKTRDLMVRTKTAAEAISPDGLSVEDRITRDMLIVIADQAIEQHDQGVHRLGVVDQISGPQTLLPQVCQFQPADTPERLEKFIARLEAYRDYMAANTDILREGLET